MASRKAAIEALKSSTSDSACGASSSGSGSWLGTNSSGAAASAVASAITCGSGSTRASGIVSGTTCGSGATASGIVSGTSCCSAADSWAGSGLFFLPDFFFLPPNERSRFQIDGFFSEADSTSSGSVATTSTGSDWLFLRPTDSSRFQIDGFFPAAARAFSTSS